MVVKTVLGYVLVKGALNGADMPAMLRCDSLHDLRIHQGLEESSSLYFMQEKHDFCELIITKELGAMENMSCRGPAVLVEEQGVAAKKPDQWISACENSLHLSVRANPCAHDLAQ